jgi:hypothetical protein
LTKVYKALILLQFVFGLTAITAMGIVLPDWVELIPAGCFLLNLIWTGEVSTC